MMGLKTSPYQTVQSFLWAEEIMRGNPTLSTNTLRWDKVVLNLPGFGRLLVGSPMGVQTAA